MYRTNYAVPGKLADLGFQENAVAPYFAATATIASTNEAAFNEIELMSWPHDACFVQIGNDPPLPELYPV